MREMLNRKMQIQVIGDVELDGKTFRPSDLNAQATDPTCDRWYIFYDTDDYTGRTLFCAPLVAISVGVA